MNEGRKIVAGDTCFGYDWVPALREGAPRTSGPTNRLSRLQSLRSAAVIPEAQNTLDRIAVAFGKLMQHAPNDYRIGKYNSVARKKIVTSIGLLKDGGLVGLAAWDTVITW